MKSLILTVLLSLVFMSTMVGAQDIVMPDHNQWKTHEKIVNGQITTYFYNFDPRPEHNGSYISVSCIQTPKANVSLIEIGTTKPFIDDLTERGEVSFNFIGKETVKVEYYPVSDRVILLDLTPSLFENIKNSEWVYAVILSGQYSVPTHGFLISTKHMDENHKVFTLCK